ncbi:unnamed protein product [Adineta ricciae]|uniref:Serine aminopeptidase S33 domain-containing protein n=1 Tax=Adineta ricciae TaxID=249248 RepID=A0A815ATW9_ADIRI|nr:unnamed protein product [Adineta ricciae]CAF1261885.1 unnamed protein product [Adineta ricciae]
MSRVTAIDYETTIFTLTPDSLGPNKATLLHARTTINNQTPIYKAILYLHGYIDYYFHDHVCQRFLEHGYDFYALDMRKCGRSIISPEHDHYIHYCTDLREYDEEISLAIEHMIKQAGGLLATLYAARGARCADIDAVILNSPYLTAVKTGYVESILLSILMKLRRTHTIHAPWYGRSIHVSGRGEWNYDVTKKPVEKLPLHGPFLSTVRTYQEEIIRGQIKIQCPILFMCSNRSLRPDRTWHDEYTDVDLILDVETMKDAARLLGPQITMHEIENAMHDIFLSKESVREKAFDIMFEWLRNLEADWSAKSKL